MLRRDVEEPVLVLRDDHRRHRVDQRRQALHVVTVRTFAGSAGEPAERDDVRLVGDGERLTLQLERVRLAVRVGFPDRSLEVSDEHPSRTQPGDARGDVLEWAAGRRDLERELHRQGSALSAPLRRVIDTWPVLMHW
jgi:hypothetical protein